MWVKTTLPSTRWNNIIIYIFIDRKKCGLSLITYQFLFFPKPNFCILKYFWNTRLWSPFLPILILPILDHGKLGNVFKFLFEKFGVHNIYGLHIKMKIIYKILFFLLFCTPYSGWWGIGRRTRYWGLKSGILFFVRKNGEFCWQKFFVKTWTKDQFLG